MTFQVSTHEQFAFLVYCYRVKAIFYNLCTVLYWRLCGLTNSPILNTLSTEADVYGAQKVLSNNGFQMANCFCCLSQNAVVCLAHCCQELQQKSWKLQDLFSNCSRLRLHDPRPTPRFSFLSSRCLETKTLVLRTTSKHILSHLQIKTLESCDPVFFSKCQHHAPSTTC